MIRKPVHLALVFVTVFCVLVQSLGAAAGGVLCIGCVAFSDSWGGLTLSEAHCTPEAGCCTKHEDDSDAKIGDGSGGTQPNDCGCFDVRLTPTIGTFRSSQAKLILSLSNLTPSPAVIFAPAVVMQDRPWVAGSRAGPIVPLLLPANRQTILLI